MQVAITLLYSEEYKCLMIRLMCLIVCFFK